MLRDVYWRQYPIDLLSDDKMTYIESFMPEEYKFAPYMFYITALKLADDNGIFDLEDGIIFARLMRVKSRALVFQIANLMRQHKIVYRLSDDTTLMQIADWTYSDKKVRTAEERRRGCRLPEAGVRIGKGPWVLAVVFQHLGRFLPRRGGPRGSEAVWKPLEGICGMLFGKRCRDTACLLP